MSTDSMAEKRWGREATGRLPDKLDAGLVRGEVDGEGVIRCDSLRKDELTGGASITLYPVP